VTDVDHVVVRVGEHLDLDVPGALHEPLDEQASVSERLPRLRGRRRERRGEVVGGLYQPHPATAAAGCGLEQKRKPDRVGHGPSLLLGADGVRAVANRDPELDGSFARNELVAASPHRLGRRADEHDPGVRARLR